MSVIYEKWRDLNVDLNKINFNNFKIKEILSYPPAGNDVIEVLTNKNENLFVKIERSKMADFDSEVKNLNLIIKEYNLIPKIIEQGNIDSKKYIVLSKIEGYRLSDLINEKKYDNSLLFKYGKELATIHKINIKTSIAKQRVINDYPKEDNYQIPKELKKYISYLINNKPKIKYDTFIHGDFHYGNILFLNNEINGIIDWEYSGLGFKEQDIAWSLILRPNQKFMDNIDDLKLFLEGYKSINNYDTNYLKWCLINGYCHFYLMNQTNNEYKNKILNMLERIYNNF